MPPKTKNTTGNANMSDVYIQKFVTHLEVSRDVIVDEWINLALKSSITHRESKLLGMETFRQQSFEFVKAFHIALRNTDMDENRITGETELANFLDEITNSRIRLKISVIETANYIIHIKRVLTQQLEKIFSSDSESKFICLNKLSIIFDKLLLILFTNYIQAREALILEQGQSIAELSTPIIKLWNQIILLPLVGAIDTTRSQRITEQLLFSITKYEARVVLLDITGVMVIDTEVAHHLLKTISAAKMLGTETIITGISPEAAVTLVKLGVDLSLIKTKGLLQTGLQEAFAVTGHKITNTNKYSS